jgi:hypothetical protein
MGRSDDIAYTYGDTVDANCDFEVQSNGGLGKAQKLGACIGGQHAANLSPKGKSPKGKMTHTQSLARSPPTPQVKESNTIGQHGIFVVK